MLLCETGDSVLWPNHAVVPRHPSDGAMKDCIDYFPSVIVIGSGFSIILFITSQKSSIHCQSYEEDKGDLPAACTIIYIW